jgi:hypothetical protein
MNKEPRTASRQSGRLLAGTFHVPIKDDNRLKKPGTFLVRKFKAMSTKR